MIPYKGGYIRKGSDAYAMWEAKEFAALDRHLAEVKQKAQQRGEIPS